jgi:F420-0:gamma-glutamyl ligase
MIVRPIKTELVLPGEKSIFDLLDESLPIIEEGAVVVITSKIVSLCENRVLPIDGTDKKELVKKESDWYLPSEWTKYNYYFSINKHSLTSSAGIDESNSGGNYYVLWPADPQKSANEIRAYLTTKYKLKEVGVVISDSTCMPMRRGTVGSALSYSGFAPTNSYIGKPDLFKRPFKVSRQGVATGLAASAVLVMGEGTEQTPLAIITEARFVVFQDHDPTKAELNDFYIEGPDEDLFAPFLKSAPWQKGERDIA